MTAKPLRVLYCHCQYANVVPKATKEAVLNGLTASGLAFDAVPDLCELSAKKDGCLKELVDGPVKIVACYPRAVKWLFHAAGVKLPEEGVDILNMRTESAEDVLKKVFAEAPVSPVGE